MNYKWIGSIDRKPCSRSFCPEHRCEGGSIGGGVSQCCHGSETVCVRAACGSGDRSCSPSGGIRPLRDTVFQAIPAHSPPYQPGHEFFLVTLLQAHFLTNRGYIVGQHHPIDPDNAES